MDKKYIKFYKTFHKKFKNDENLILCSNLLSDGGVSSTQLSFKPSILRRFQKSSKNNSGKNNPKIFTYFLVLMEVIRG